MKPHRKILGLTLTLGLLACSQTPTTSQIENLLIVPIQSGDTPEMYGNRLVAWYPELGQAIVGEESNQRLSLQGAVRSNNLRVMQILETRKAATDLGMPVRSTGWSTWSTGWSTWSTGWSTWSTGQDSVFKTGQNQDIWRQIGLSEAQASFSKRGMGVKIAVIDTGIDLTHPAFANRLVAPSERYDFVDNDTVPQETKGEAYGHGTNIAGIIAQIAEKAQIMPLRVLDGNGTGDSDDVVSAINWAVQKGAKVINLSLGTYDSAALALALDNATRKGVFVVTASGNNGDNDVNFPARACGSNGKNGRWGDMAISVTSVNKFDELSRFSSYGKDDVGMSAPGELIYAPAPDNRVAAWSGTSMAAPMVAASLALALAERPYQDLRDLGKAVREKSFNIEKFNPNRKKEIGRGRLDLRNFAQEVKKLK